MPQYIVLSSLRPLLRVCGEERTATAVDAGTVLVWSLSVLWYFSFTSALPASTFTIWVKCKLPCYVLLMSDLTMTTVTAMKPFTVFPHHARLFQYIFPHSFLCSLFHPGLDGIFNPEAVLETDRAEDGSSHDVLCFFQKQSGSLKGN